jgi:LysM repeat protein
MKTGRLMMRLMATGLCGLALAGCVMAEKYEAEKARSLNFQRLLAQEEKRTGELDSELKRTKAATTEMEAKNRELGAQLQTVREQLVKVQEDSAATLKAIQQHQQEEIAKAPRVAAKPRKPAKAASALDPLLSNDLLLAAPEPAAGASEGAAQYHQVKPGETLFKISKKYNVQMKSLRTWNHLNSDQIEVGQRLVVGYQ